MYDRTLAYLMFRPDPLNIDLSAPGEPAELTLLNELDAWRTLPVIGGYLDQPATLMADLRVVRSALKQYRQSETVRIETAGSFADLAGKARGLTGSGSL